MSLIAAIAFAALTTVKLPVAGGAQETFFLPFDSVSADTSTIALKTADGRDVPFSLDMRLGFPRDGKYRPPADGYRSVESAPAKEGKYRRLGWLSFRAPDGVEELTLTFKTAQGKAVERPNPAVRTWWVSLIDPAARAKCPPELCGHWVVPAQGLPPLEKLAGRRFLASVVTMALKEIPRHSYLGVRIPNASRSRKNLIAMGFSSGHEPVESIADSVVAEDAKDFVDAKRPVELSSCYSSDASLREGRPLRIDDIRFQSPPWFRAASSLRPACDLYNAGDVIRIKTPALEGEFLADFHSPAFSGERVMEGVAASEVKTAVALVDAKGCVVRKARGETLATDGVAPGCYILVAALRAGSLEIARTRTAVEVQPAPDWAK